MTRQSRSKTSVAAAHGREELRDGLDRFDRSERLPRRDHPPGLGQLDEDDVAELLLGELGDADLGDLAADADPLVVLRVFQVGRI
jgi:hypothetical protein